MPWLIWVCPVPVQCPQPGIQTRGWAGPGGDITLDTLGLGSLLQLLRHTCHGLVRLIQDGDVGVGVGVGDPLVCAAAV